MWVALYSAVWTSVRWGLAGSFTGTARPGRRARSRAATRLARAMYASVVAGPGDGLLSALVQVASQQPPSQHGVVRLLSSSESLSAWGYARKYAMARSVK